MAPNLFKFPQRLPRQISLRAKRNGSLGFPPGPFGLPLLGHLHMLGDLPHHSLHKLAKKYGPIVFIRLGLVPVIVASSPEWAESILKTHDSVFASRPKIQASECMSYGQKNLAFAQYGPYWRNIRKLCTLELLRPIRREELVIFVETIKTAAISRSVIDVSSNVESLIEDVTDRMIFGLKDDKFNLRSSLQQAVIIIGAFNLADFIPYLRAFDLQTHHLLFPSRPRIHATEYKPMGEKTWCLQFMVHTDQIIEVETLFEVMTYRMIFGVKEDRFNFKQYLQEEGFGRRMKAINMVLDGVLEKIIDDYVQDAKELHGRHRDFIDVMLSLMESNNRWELHLGRDYIKAIMLDMLGASMDTSSTTIEWVITELLKHRV
ncbi:hypothetical protein IFM89_003085 [Coptis chinensis]|uniref:Cytochrome P450 n=1 Tax=Coptis chinensis TaxID=261450 RepID=A0A835IB52_9MAGN|nr:hypothetical protein IFM89_003085 [Coptis chinensis]